MESIEILKGLDNLSIEGLKYIKEYVRNKGGHISFDYWGKDKGKDKMYAIIFNYDIAVNIEMLITAIKVEGEELGICLGDEDREEDWYYSDIYLLPTIQSILEAIDQY